MSYHDHLTPAARDIMAEANKEGIPMFVTCIDDLVTAAIFNVAARRFLRLKV